MSATLEFSIGGFSHVGRREYNEDRYCVLGGKDNNSVLVLVADGMGGHTGGALAAQTIIDAATAQWSGPDADDPPEQLLTKLVAHCHELVVAAGQNAGLQPRATLAALLVYLEGGVARAISVHVGDSRIMQFSDSALVTQTIDHSLAQLKVLQGRIQQEDVAKDADQNKVLNCIGGDELPEPELVRWDLQQGNRFVVCSDGFWELFSPEEMLSLFTAADNAEGDGDTLPEIIEQRYLSKLEKTSSQDNTTGVLLAQVGAGPRTASSPSLSVPPPAITAPGSIAAGNRRQAIVALAATVLLAALAFVLYPRAANEDAAPATNGTTNQNGSAPDTPSRREPGAGSPPETVPPQSGSPGERGQVADGAALNTVDQEISVTVANDQELIDAVARILRDAGELDANDGLVVLREGDIDGSRVVRLSQEHQGIPVFGGEIVVVQRGDTLTNLSGATGTEITVDTTPALTYEQAVAQAATTSGQTLQAEDDGTLFIFDSAGTFHLAWIGQVVADGALARIVLDADDGAILARFPMRIEGDR